MVSIKKTKILIDTSGSMLEGGKRLIARNIVRQVEQFIRFKYGVSEIQLISISEDISHISWSVDDEYPEGLLACKGRLNDDQLISCFQENDCQYLFLSDCAWTLDSTRKIGRALEKLPSDLVRIVKIGSDCMISPKRIKIFSAEEIFLALDGWLGGLSA